MGNENAMEWIGSHSLTYTNERLPPTSWRPVRSLGAEIAVESRYAPWLMIYVSCHWDAYECARFVARV